MSRSSKDRWRLRPEDAPPAWLIRREPLLHGVEDNPLFRLILFRRNRLDRLHVSILSYLAFGLTGAAIATFGALTWPVVAWFLATWCILSLELADRPGWVAPRGDGLAGMTALPRRAVEDLDLAGTTTQAMSLALWASTLSRNVLFLWLALFSVGVATCWGRLWGIARGGVVYPVAWLWLLPLGYVCFRAALRLLTPCHTLPHCVSLLEYARVQWWRRHQPWRYILQTSITLARHLVLIGALLMIAAIAGLGFGNIYRALPLDPNDPGVLLAAGIVSMLAGAMLGAFYRPVLEKRRDRYLERSGELIRWLIEREREKAEGPGAQPPPTGRREIETARAS